MSRKGLKITRPSIADVLEENDSSEGDLKISRRRSRGEDLTLGDVHDPDAEDTVLKLAATASMDEIVYKFDPQDVWTSNTVWHPRRLLATPDRIYILLKRDPNSSKYEVADYINMEEILNIASMKLDAMSRRKGGKTSNLTEDSTAVPARTVSSVVASVLFAERPVRTVDDGGGRQITRIPSDGGGRQTTRIPSDGTDGADQLRVESAFEIQTSSDGFSQGKTYHFSTGSRESRDLWVRSVREWSSAARKAFERLHRMERLQYALFTAYESTFFQSVVGIAITSNFIITITQNQLVQEEYADTFETIDLVFTILFAAELIFNFAAHAVWPFFADGWNIFDLCVVLTSVTVLMVTIEDNAMVKQMRVLRAFRAIRVFRRFGELRRIVSAIVYSILPGIQALLIGLVIMSIYAVLGVQFFGDEAPPYFGDFFHAFYTLFGVVAYARWPEDSVTPFDSQGHGNAGVIVYIYSYVVVVIFVLVNVFVAVVLASFARASDRDKQKYARQVEAGAAAAAAGGGGARGAGSAAAAEAAGVGPLRAIVERVATNFDTEEDLMDRASHLFRTLDLDASGKLSHPELAAGLRRAAASGRRRGAGGLGGRRAKGAAAAGGRLTLEDFHWLTDRGRLCNERGELEVGGFQELVRREVERMAQRRVADALYCMEPPPAPAALLAAMKMILVDVALARDALALRDAAVEEAQRRVDEVERLGDEKFDQLYELLGLEWEPYPTDSERRPAQATEGGSPAGLSWPPYSAADTPRPEPPGDGGGSSGVAEGSAWATPRSAGSRASLSSVSFTPNSTRRIGSVRSGGGRVWAPPSPERPVSLVVVGGGGGAGGGDELQAEPVMFVSNHNVVARPGPGGGGGNRGGYYGEDSELPTSTFSSPTARGPVNTGNAGGGDGGYSGGGEALSGGAYKGAGRRVSWGEAAALGHGAGSHASAPL